MKKLMIMAFAIAVASVASASNWKWGADTGRLYGGTMTADEITSGAVAYLFDASFTQQQLLDALNGGTSLATAFDTYGIKAAPSLGVSEDAKFEQSGVFAYGTAGQDYAFYMAVVADSMAGKVFITDATELYGAAAVESPTEVWMDSMTNPSSQTFTSTTFSEGAWYTVQTVPEPTSGLLLLLGVAGLALRRRRA